jgi:hypothetical protein
MNISDEILILFKHTCKEMLASKLSKGTIENLIALTALLSSNAQFLKISNHEQKNLKTKLTDEKFLVMVTHLVCAELRVALDSSDINDGRLQLHYSLLENIIRFLVTNGKVLAQTVLGSIRKAMAETYLAVADFLSERLDMFLDTKDLDVIDNFATVCSFRAYCVWTSEETSVSIEELDRLTPLFVEILQTK